ncbi:MAG: glycosyltransferase family 39 protein [Acidobacteria bacterium]|nr:glycosyltransferase family 39 protein [Acidobacteriota bacterium]
MPRTEKNIPAITKLLFHPSLLLLLTFLAMLLVSWRRWTSLIVDTGREMDLPLRLLHGELLYRDIHFLYPPFSPYFNALLYRLFGSQLEVLNVSGIICSLIIVMLCYRIARRILDVREVTLATMAIIVWCIFKPEGNLIAPYAFSALHAMIFALGTLLITLRYGEKQMWQNVILGGIAIGLAGITKQEFALTAAVTFTSGLFFVHRFNFRLMLPRLFAAAGIALVIALPVYAYFLDRVGWQTLIEDCHLLYTKIPASLVFYNSARTGLDHPISSLLQMLGGAAVAIGIASVIVLLSTWGKGNRRLRKNAGVILAACLVLAIAINIISRGRWDGSPLRALPIALVGLMLIHFFRKDAAKPQFALFVIAAYSLMALIRVVLRVPSGGAFGGYFLPTSLILIVYLTIESFPAFTQKIIVKDAEKDAASVVPFNIKSRFQIIGLTILGIWLMATMIVFGYRYRKTFPALIQAPNGSLYATAETAPATQEAIAFLLNNSGPADAVAIVPEGSSLAFLTGRYMPLRHQILIPDFMDEQEEIRAVEKLRTVKFALVINRPMREFGLEAFARDYYQKMGQVLQEEFHIVKVCGEVSDADPAIGNRRFFIKILQKNEGRNN